MRSKGGHVRWNLAQCLVQRPQWLFIFLVLSLKFPTAMSSCTLSWDHYNGCQGRGVLFSLTSASWESLEEPGTPGRGWSRVPCGVRQCGCLYRMPWADSAQPGPGASPHTCPGETTGSGRLALLAPCSQSPLGSPEGVCREAPPCV